MDTLNIQTPDDAGSEAGYGATIRVPVPATDPDLYRYEVTDELLRFLVDRPFEAYTQRKLAAILDRPHRSIGLAVDVLATNGVLNVSAEGNRKHISINRERVSTPAEPVLRIPQAEFHEPVRSAIDELIDELDGVLGIEVYGSVARGEADRRSDVDLWVLVRENRGRNQARARDAIHNLSDRSFDGDRYDFHVVVETPETVPTYTEEIADIVRSGITLYHTEEFDEFRTQLEDLVDE